MEGNKTKHKIIVLFCFLYGYINHRHGWRETYVQFFIDSIYLQLLYVIFFFFLTLHYKNT